MNKHLTQFDTIRIGAQETIAAERATAAVAETIDHRITNWIDIKITGPTRAAVERAVADYRVQHAACDPKPAFYNIYGNEADGFRVAGSRGRDPRK